jgi:glutamate synthase domain-containing protein 2
MRLADSASQQKYLVNADELQIKIAQARNRVRGQLPGIKWTNYCKNTALHSGHLAHFPPPHHDIYSIEDLAQLFSI